MMRIRKEYTTLGVLLAISGVGWASRLPTFQQPETHRSPDGAFELYVDPSDMHGAGPATYTMRGSGEVLWKRELPFTLSDAIITVEGNTIGYGYTAGLDSLREHVDEVVLSLLDATGEILVSKRIPRGPSRFLPSPNLPYVREFSYEPTTKIGWFYLPESVLPEEKGELIVLDVTKNSFQEPLHLLELLNQSKGRITDIVQVSGTPFIGVAWMMENNFRIKDNHQISILDTAGKEYWRLPRIASDFDRAKLHSSVPLQLGFADQSEWITFQLSEKPAGWEALELSRVPLGENLPTVESEPQIIPVKLSEEIPASAASVYRRFSLDRSVSSSSGYTIDTNIFFDAEGNVYSLGDYRNFGRLQLIQKNNQLLHSTTLKMNEFEPTFSVAWVDHLNVVLLGKMPENQHSDSAYGLFEFNLATNELKAVGNYEFWGRTRISTGPNGTILICSYKTKDINHGGILRLLTRQGEMLLELNQNEINGRGGNSQIKDACLLTDGTIAVLDDYPARVELISSDGTRKGAINLEESWGYKPNYLSNIHPGPDGTIVVTDNNGRYPTVHMDATGKVLHKYRKRGTVDPFGAFWVSDGFTLKQENEEGEVLATLGTKPGDQLSGPMESITVDQDGRLYLLPKRSGIPFVFDEAGKLLYKADIPEGTIPNPETALYSLLIPGDGGLYYTAVEAVQSRELPQTTWKFQFDAQGNRIAEEKLIGGTSEKDIQNRTFFLDRELPLMTNGNVWRREYSSVQLKNLQGDIINEIKRDALNNWLILPKIVQQGPNGLILVSNSTRSKKDPQQTLTAFTPNGEVHSTFILPDEAYKNLRQGAWDGQHLYVPLNNLIVVFNSQGEALTSVPVPSTEKTWKPFVTKTGTELWLFDGEREVVCYKIAELISPTITASE